MTGKTWLWKQKNFTEGIVEKNIKKIYEGIQACVWENGNKSQKELELIPGEEGEFSGLLKALIGLENTIIGFSFHISSAISGNSCYGSFAFGSLKILLPNMIMGTAAFDSISDIVAYSLNRAFANRTKSNQNFGYFFI